MFDYMTVEILVGLFLPAIAALGFRHSQMQAMRLKVVHEKVGVRY